MRIKTDEGIREVEGLDINVWLDEGSGKVNITAYEVFTREDGYLDTNTHVTLFSAETDLSPDDYADEWYGWGSGVYVPDEVLRLVRHILSDVEIREPVTR